MDSTKLRIRQWAPFITGLSFGLCSILLGWSLISQSWSVSHLGKVLSGHAGLSRWCLEVAFGGAGGKCGSFSHESAKTLFRSLGAKAPGSVAGLLVASRILTDIAFVCTVLGSMWAMWMAGQTWTPRSWSVLPLIISIVGFVTSLLGVIFWGVVHKNGFRASLAASTLFPSAKLGYSWRMALTGCIFTALTLAPSIVDLALNTHRPDRAPKTSAAAKTDWSAITSGLKSKGKDVGQGITSAASTVTSGVSSSIKQPINVWAGSGEQHKEQMQKQQAAGAPTGEEGGKSE